MGNEQGTPKVQQAGRRHHGHLPSNARLMGSAVKQRLAKGNSKSTYNMKVVIRGDRQTGKSALFHRLEGGGFIKEHRVTAQLQTSHVLWPYKTSDEMVNLEIWDVVDKAIVPTNIPDDNLSITPSIVSKNLMPADATTIDIYKGAHAVIFMVDPTRKWTFDYVQTNIEFIPDGIDCVILFNKKDVAKHWTLTEDEISEFMAAQKPNVRALQISLQDCYGMKELHSFFNVPFLRMKAKYLQQELARAQREHEQSKVELDIFIKHQNYDEFLNRLRALKDHKNRKMKSPAPPHSHSPDSPVTAPALPVKQTVRSSKDLPLIQQLQQQKQQQMQQAPPSGPPSIALQKGLEAPPHRVRHKEDDEKGHEDILEFKPAGGLDEDFFAVDGEQNEEDSKEDEDSEEGQVGNDSESDHAVQPDHNQIRRLQKPMMITADGVTTEDSQSEEDEEALTIDRKSKIEHVSAETEPKMNGHRISSDADSNHRSSSPNINEGSKVDTFDGFSNGDVNAEEKENVDDEDLYEESAESEHAKLAKVPNGDSAKMSVADQEEDAESDADADAGSNRKLQSLMKLQPADVHVDESDSDEYDDEPLVFATAPKEVKAESEDIIRPKQQLRPKAQVIGSTKSVHGQNAIDMKSGDNTQSDDDVRNGTHCRAEKTETPDRGQQDAFNSLLKDLGQSTSPRSPNSVRSPSPESVEDGSESEEDDAARRRRKEEKRARKEERRRRREEKRRRKKEKKRRRKRKKDNDLQEFSDSDEIVEIE